MDGIEKRWRRPSTQPCECEDCGFRYVDDIYFVYAIRGHLCGDCCYKYRHGKWPTKNPGFRYHVGQMSDERFNGGFGSHTLHRVLEMDAVTETHANYLDGWLNDCELSIL